ncbi:MAG TPA: Gfo/Idh/MocA family oxidoreductase [Vicinamibacterales bacterium]|nr:Gfo/Idh/MocA family oxidoreductase [Vicinamibacterales bacterium]
MISRRDFVKDIAATTAAVTIVPRHVLGRGQTPPSDRLNIAGVGVGGMGRTNLLNLGLDNNSVALCDVDWGFAGPLWQSARLEADLKREQDRLAKMDLTPEARRNSEHRVSSLQKLIKEDVPKQKRYRDFRIMLEEQKDIDAVVVATPDHMHASIAMAAMDLNKHVYVQKPLCWSVDEARKLARKARQAKVVTQMGNQGHSWDDGRKAVEWVQSGAIGDVTEVHVWTNRPLSYWPQGIPRPEPKRLTENMRWNMNGVMARLANAMGIYAVPEDLDWDLFLGPAPQVEYHPVYHPFNWRGWVDWGAGALGDMGAHLLDHSYWALDLGYPTSVETVSTPFDKQCFPMASKTYYEFPARGSKPPVKLTWYDGGMFPPTPPEFADGEKLNAEGGAIMVGTKGKVIHNTYGLGAKLLPASLHESVGNPKQTLPRITTSHEVNWSNACKGIGEASSPFEYAAKLTEVMLLGIVAMRAGVKIRYDGADMRVTNSREANDLLKREYRRGWSL